MHHSYLVNINEVEKYIKGEGGYLMMSDGSTIDVSRSRKELLLKKLLPGKTKNNFFSKPKNFNYISMIFSGKQSSSVKAIKIPFAFFQPVLREAAGPFFADKDKNLILIDEKTNIQQQFV